MKKPHYLFISILAFVIALSLTGCPVTGGGTTTTGSTTATTPPFIPANANFVSTWNTANTSSGSSSADQIKLPFESSGFYDCTINWGDGTTSHITKYDDPEILHTYTVSGTYVITIKGTVIGFRFNNTGDRLKIMNIANWEGLNFGNNGNYFSGCSNLTISASDIPDLTGTTNMNAAFAVCKELTTVPSMKNWDVSNINNMMDMFNGDINFNQDISTWNVSNVNNMMCMFQNASSLNQDIGKWNVSKVKYMGYMFYHASSFNQNIGNWIVSNVTDMSAMFSGATSFNQNIGNWNVSNVTSMSYMFTNATSFNQNIGNWNVSKVTDMTCMFSYAASFNQDIGNWDVSKITNMNNMFIGNKSFNQDISNWNVSNVIDMQSMFNGASSFNQDIGNWDISKVQNMTAFLNNIELTTANYDSLLIKWSNLIVTNGINFSGGNSRYSPGAAATARQKLITTYGWTITDGGQL